MPESKLLRDLTREIKVLRKHFLPDPFDPLGRYPNPTRVQSQTRAFLVLSHAELETYLEEWAKDIARTCELAWTTSQKTSGPFAFLLATASQRIQVPEKLTGKNPKDSPQKLTDETVQMFLRYYKTIKENHGIKEHNVLSLFFPLGVPASAIAPSLVPKLESLGAARGVLAHHSRRVVIHPLDPELEHKRITDLIAELKPLDQWLVKYKRRIR